MHGPVPISGQRGPEGGRFCSCWKGALSLGGSIDNRRAEANSTFDALRRGVFGIGLVT